MKIGFVSMPFAGHLNPMTALARKLQSRGHTIVVVGVPDVEPLAPAADLKKAFTAFLEKRPPNFTRANENENLKARTV